MPHTSYDQSDTANANNSDTLSTSGSCRIRPRISEGGDGDEDSILSSHSNYGTVEAGNPNPSDGQPLLQKDDSSSTKAGGISSYLHSRHFYTVLVLSQLLAICDTGTNTITTLLANEGTSIPALQSLSNYVLLNLIYTSWTIHKYGFRKWVILVYRDGWKFFILALFDVEGNYFTVLAYRYTTILSAQLIGFWAIAVVVMVSVVFLRVRYHFAQYAGILICCVGLGMMITSDRIMGVGDGGRAVNVVRGDFFCLLGATCYGLANVLEEFLVSKRPVYEVVGQLGFWAMFINGMQTVIFDRQSFQTAVWNSKVFGLFAGYTLILTFFYSTAPIILRMASAAFLNIGLLTGNFWGLIIGLKLFHLRVHWMYPVAFVLIIGGHFVYHGTEGFMGEAKKPWLGVNQEGGLDGVGTARRKLERPDVTV